jgi:hypothetical protein
MSSIPVSLNDKFAELLKIVKELNPSEYEAVNAKFKEAATAINAAVRMTITFAAEQKEAEKCAECSEPAVMGHDGHATCQRCYDDNTSDIERCVECGEAVDDEEGWTDSKGKQYCGDCKEEADNYDPLEGLVKHEYCPGDEADYDFVECCDTGCKYKGHYVKKTGADKTDGRTDGEDEEERKWASHFVKNEALSS